jgi:hypothetical protein
MDISAGYEGSRQVGHIRDEDVEFKILVFTDNHVGFKETHPVRGQVEIVYLGLLRNIGGNSSDS